MGQVRLDEAKTIDAPSQISHSSQVETSSGIPAAVNEEFVLICAADPLI
jgi:hypothetical protein